MEMLNRSKFCRTDLATTKQNIPNQYSLTNKTHNLPFLFITKY